MFRNLFYSIILTVFFTVSPLIGQSLAKNTVLDGVESERDSGKISARDLVKKYKDEIAKTPNNPELYVKAAAVYPRVESEALYQKAIAIAPNYLPAYLGLARYYSDNNFFSEARLKKALAAYQKAVALSPKDAVLKSEAVANVNRVATLPDFQKMFGITIAARLAYCQSLITNRKLEEATKEIAAIPKSPANESKILLLKVRLECSKQTSKKTVRNGKRFGMKP